MRTLLVLPAYWDDVTNSAAFQQLTSTARADDTIRQALKELAAGLPDAASALGGSPRGCSALSFRL